MKPSIATTSSCKVTQFLQAIFITAYVEFMGTMLRVTVLWEIDAGNSVIPLCTNVCGKEKGCHSIVIYELVQKIKLIVHKKHHCTISQIFRTTLYRIATTKLDSSNYCEYRSSWIFLISMMKLRMTLDKSENETLVWFIKV